MYLNVLNQRIIIRVPYVGKKPGTENISNILDLLYIIIPCFKNRIFSSRQYNPIITILSIIHVHQTIISRSKTLPPNASQRFRKCIYDSRFLFDFIFLSKQFSFESACINILLRGKLYKKRFIQRIALNVQPYETAAAEKLTKPYFLKGQNNTKLYKHVLSMYS